MPIYAKAGTDFKPAPPGTHAGVCVDVVDLGMVTSDFGGKKKTQHKIKIVWQIDEARDDGKPFDVSQRYTLSLHAKATLRRELESWRGRAFTEDELKEFDVETVIGAGAMLNIIHAFREGKTYANVTGVMRLMKGMAAPVPRDYVRVCDRNLSAPGAPGAPDGEWGDEYPSDLDEVPF